VYVVRATSYALDTNVVEEPFDVFPLYIWHEAVILDDEPFLLIYKLA
jgi:hypothetical protein